MIEKLQELVDVRRRIKEAIEYYGVVVDSNMKDYGDFILQIDKDDIQNQIFVVKDGTKFSGSTVSQFPKLITSSVTNMDLMFIGCTNLSICPEMDTSKVTTMQYAFANCSNLTKTSILDISNVVTGNGMFEASGIREVYFKGQPKILSSDTYMFDGMVENGVLYYDSRYDYSVVMDLLPSTWTAIPFDYAEE